MGTAAQRLDRVVPLRAVRRSLEDVSQRAEEGDPVAQNVLLTIAAQYPALLGIRPEHVGIKMGDPDAPAPDRNPVIHHAD